MDFILWRHAEAEDGTPDEARELTKLGRKQARVVAKWLRPRLPRDVRILASPAARARQTAEALEMRFETAEQIGLDATVESVLSVIGPPAKQKAMIVVGHQPILGRVAATLLSGKDAEWSIRKGAVWWFSIEDKEYKLSANLRAVVGPDLAEA